MTYEIRAMSFGEILDLAFRLVRNHFAVLVGVASVIYVPFAIASSWMSVAPQRGASMFGVGFVLLIVIFLVVVSPVVSAAITYAVGEIYLGRTAAVGDSLRAGLSIVVPLVGTSFLAGLAIVVGFILLVIPGLYLWLAFLLLGQVMVLERTFGVAALRRSRELMRGSLLRGFGIVLLAGIIVGVLSSVLELVLGAIPVLGPIGSGLAQAAGGVYSATVAVILYFDIRCRKEAFDIEHLARLVEARGGAAVPAMP